MALSVLDLKIGDREYHIERFPARKLISKGINLAKVFGGGAATFMDTAGGFANLFKEVEDDGAESVNLSNGIEKILSNLDDENTFALIVGLLDNTHQGTLHLGDPKSFDKAFENESLGDLLPLVKEVLIFNWRPFFSQNKVTINPKV